MTRTKAPDGTYEWRGGFWERSNGRRWARSSYSLTPGRLSNPRPLNEDPSATPPQREQLLDQAVEAEVLLGADLVHRSELAAILGYRRTVNHLGHALMTLLTAGLWAVVWLLMVLDRKQRRVRYVVDRWGHVWPAETTLTGWSGTAA